MNLYEKMAAITAELQTVAKNLDVKVNNSSSYKAVSERDILDAVKPLEEKYGIYSYPCDREILESAVLESEATYNGKTTSKSTFFTRMKTTYMFVNTENPEERITTITFSEGIDTQDKGSGKAMTYADKYALMKSYKISTGDDPDQEPSEDGKYKKSGNQPKKSQDTIKCIHCGSVIKDTIQKDGTTLPANEVANYSVKRFGGPYCVECQRKIMENVQKKGGNNESES